MWVEDGEVRERTQVEVPANPGKEPSDPNLCVNRASLIAVAIGWQSGCVNPADATRTDPTRETTPLGIAPKDARSTNAVSASAMTAVESSSIPCKKN